MARSLCKNCNKKWTLTSICSKECLAEWRFKSAIKRLPKKICKICENSFQPINKLQSYCSKECCAFANKERVTKLRDSHFSIFKRDGFRCIYCGKSTIENRKITLHVDHVIPVFKGGSFLLDNLVTSCSICNISKGTTSLNDKIIERIQKVLNKRNKKLTDEMIFNLDKEIMVLKLSRPKR